MLTPSSFSQKDPLISVALFYLNKNIRIQSMKINTEIKFEVCDWSSKDTSKGKNLKLILKIAAIQCLKMQLVLFQIYFICLFLLKLAVVQKTKTNGRLQSYIF